MIPLPYKLLAAAMALGLAYLSGWYSGASSEGDRWEARIAEQKTDAAIMLADATAHVLLMEREAKDRTRQIEVNYAKHQVEIHTEQDRNTALNTELERLRDTRRRARCPSPVSKPPTTPGELADAAASARIAERIADVETQFAEFADRAAVAGDEARAYARACHAWAATVSAPE